FLIGSRGIRDAPDRFVSCVAAKGMQQRAWVLTSTRGVVGRIPDGVRRYRVPQYRLTLVREATISTPWDKTVRQSADVAALMTPLVADLDRERFVVRMLDAKHRVLGLNIVATGSLNVCLVHCREV